MSDKYQKLPIMVDAVQVRPVGNLAGKPTEAMNFIQESGYGCTWDADKHKLYMPTLEGRMSANPGDFIIRGVKGEIYPCNLDVFLETYTKVKA